MNYEQELKKAINRYEDALKVYESIKYYKDSDDKINECYYKTGKEYYYNGDYKKQQMNYIIAMVIKTQKI